MRGRQVQYTDGSWSREVEVADDLLDEATRLVGLIEQRGGVRGSLKGEAGIALRALVERVQQAESALRVARVGEALGEVAVRERDSLRFELDGARSVARKDNEHLIAERDAARGKLDKVRRLIPTENPELIESGYGIDSGDILAILDGKTGE